MKLAWTVKRVEIFEFSSKFEDSFLEALKLRVPFHRSILPAAPGIPLVTGRLPSTMLVGRMTTLSSLKALLGTSKNSTSLALEVARPKSEIEISTMQQAFQQSSSLAPEETQGNLRRCSKHFFAKFNGRCLIVFPSSFAAEEHLNFRQSESDWFLIWDFQAAVPLNSTRSFGWKFLDFKIFTFFQLKNL